MEGEYVDINRKMDRKRYLTSESDISSEAGRESRGRESQAGA